MVAQVSGPEQDIQPLAVYRVFATREGGRWVLANALPRLTQRWQRETIGRITFVFPPTHRFVRARAEATAAFVDSLAHAFPYRLRRPLVTTSRMTSVRPWPRPV